MTQTIVNEYKDSLIDYNTGEVKQEHHCSHTTIKSKEPEYVKLYIKAWSEFREIKGINTTFLNELIPHMTWADDDKIGGQIVALSSYRRKMIAHKLNWSEKTLTKRFSLELNKLCKSGVLVKLENNVYRVNPDLFGKGYWADINRVRRTFYDEVTQLKVTFDLETGEITHKYKDNITDEEK